ncbi:LamG domain-containing protein [Arenibacter sp. GZD96]|uniref:LamG domain-containing protein n=1 Tax=Aurantibrevibacter litoralis TaxID=3106030 RepID=UPI002AFECA94|nr:LamG domain-containing protein [Arenibacter sp. GZD-96]MEA1786086.1 LamG domain-containing protein [Arenibacter sp. GZD-96]
MAVIPTSSSLDIDGTEITIMVDIYPTANGQANVGVIVQKGYNSGGDNVYAIGYNSSNKIRWRNFINGTRRDFISTTSAPLNTWSRIICVWKTGEPKIIRINSSTNSDAASYSGSQSVASTNNLTIGSNDATTGSETRSFVGRADNVMIWNRALTTEEQNTLINENLGFSDFAPSSGGSGAGVWSTSGSTAYYNGGNVGIGTSDPGTYRLAVNGNVHAKEVKVDLIGWADYVFEKDYDLPSLEEVERHILEKGHLINIPSAAEVKAEGIELGQMDRLLLEKIEELTLYILQLKKENTEQKLRIDWLVKNNQR